MKNIINKLKFRIFNGFWQKEYINLYYYNAKFLLPRLKALKENTKSYPQDLTEEEWEEILNKIILAFTIILNEKLFFNIMSKENDNHKVITEGFTLYTTYYFDLWS